MENLILKKAVVPGDGETGGATTTETSVDCPVCSCLIDCNIAASIGIDCNELLLFEEEYKTHMSDLEKQIFDDLTRIQQLSYLANAQFASWAAESKYPNELLNGKGDALRHAFWNAFNVIDLGFDLTESLTSAHENMASGYDYSFKETMMDLFNNEAGRGIAINWQRNPVGSLEQAIYGALYRGDLRYLNNLLPSGRATSSSQLTPTNQ